jgi:NAD(P)-dependent dehydrogenase (short-subunit alcohol dehydrogenase family)
MKNVIISGANGNLGTATVRKFLSEGYKVIAVDNHNDHLGFAEGNTNFSFYNIDLSNEEATHSFISQIIQQHIRIDAAIMLVGGFSMGDITSTTGEDIRKQYSLNFETAYFLTQPLYTHMREHGYGRIVFIGARPAINAAQGKGLIAYALAKSLLFKLADFINEDAKGKNICASVVVPSTIDTAINRQTMPDADFNNWVKPEQIAEVLEFICSEKGSAIREAVYKVYNNA